MKNTLGSFLLALFSLPFAGIGVFTGYLAYDMVASSYTMQSWPTVDAYLDDVTLDSNVGSKSTTYNLKAQYRYFIDGQQYHGSRVSLSAGSDNIGTFHQDNYSILQDYKSRNEPYPAKVNPIDPKDAILIPDIRSGMLLFYLVFAVCFGGVGFGLLAAALTTTKQEKENSQLSGQHPDEPWMHRQSWADRKLTYSAKSTFIIGFVVAIIVNAMTVPALISIPEQVFIKKNYALLFVLIFNAVGLLILYASIKAFLGWRRFGTSTFELTTLPAVPGKTLEGYLNASSALQPLTTSVHATLICTSSLTTGTGKNRSTRTTELSRDEKSFPLSPGPHGVRAHVRMTIPPGAASSSSLHSNPRISWKLTFAASVPGVDYSSEFEVPVFFELPKIQA